VTYDQIGNDPVQLTSKESVEFRLSHTKREPTPFNDYDSWRVTFRFV
jgi:hypothetical protein